MNKLGAKIEYIYHSGFTVETENYFLVFDYYKGDIKPSNKKTIVFVTHGHDDHYNPNIFDFKGDIDYVLSDDIQVNKDVHFVKPGLDTKIEDLDIKVFGSTDLGVSFLVSVDEMNIFHAGDLNWWYWENDTPIEKENMEKEFKEEVSKIKSYNVDIAFFPVDPRLGDAYGMGGKYFIKEVSPNYFIPMHFGDNYDTTSKFIHKMTGTNTHIVEISNKNQLILL